MDKKNYCLGNTECFPIVKDIRGWKLLSNEQIGEKSVYGTIFQVCKDYSCIYVLKCMRESHKDIEKEVYMQDFCSEYGLCMPVEDWWLCGHKDGFGNGFGGAVITRLLQTTLFRQLTFVDYLEGIKLINRAVLIILLLHEIGIAHFDCHANNFMLGEGEKIFLIDMGMAIKLDLEDINKRHKEILFDYEKLYNAISIDYRENKFKSFDKNFEQYLNRFYSFLENFKKIQNVNKISQLYEEERTAVEHFILGNNTQFINKDLSDSFEKYLQNDNSMEGDSLDLNFDPTGFFDDEVFDGIF